MKLSRLKRIIKEEYYNVLSEAFADPQIRKLAKFKSMGGRWQNFFKNFANTHDIAWDKLPAGTLNKSTNLNDPMIKNGLVFWMIDNEKPNPHRNDRFWSSVYSLKPGVLAVTLNGNIQYMSGQKTYSGGRGDASAAVGQAGRGMLQVKKRKDMADSLLVMDFETFRGGTKALKAKRAELKLGKDTFKDHRAWKRANLQRYKDIMDARVGSRDTVDAMVGKIVKLANEAVATGMEVVKTNNYDALLTTVNGNEVELNYVTSAMTRALRSYAEYIRYANAAEKDATRDWGGDYNDKAAKESAGYIKKILNAFESGNNNELGRY